MNNIKIDVNGNTNTIAGRDIISNIQKLPSILGKALPALVDFIDNLEEQKIPPNKPYSIDKKINFNNLNVYKNYVEKHSIYGNIIDSIYENLDKSQPMSKKKIFNYLEKKYVDSKVEYIHLQKNQSEVEIIKQYADKIFEKTMSSVKTDLEKSDIGKISVEELEVCVLVIVCHGFINCKILENVPNDYR